MASLSISSRSSRPLYDEAEGYGQGEGVRGCGGLALALPGNKNNDRAAKDHLYKLSLGKSRSIRRITVLWRAALLVVLALPVPGVATDAASLGGAGSCYPDPIYRLAPALHLAAAHLGNLAAHPGARGDPLVAGFS